MDYGTKSSGMLESLNPNSHIYPSHTVQYLERPSISQMMTVDFYKRPVNSWFAELCEGLFKVQIRESTIKAEVYYGLIHYISCFYCLAVIPPLMRPVGYESGPLFLSICLTSGIGCLIGGIVTNLPFPFAPPTVVSIFLASYLKKYTLDATAAIGSAGVIVSGCCVTLLGYRPLSDFIGRLIPSSIQVGTSVGIGLLTALAGTVEIGLVRPGNEGALLQMGTITAQVVVALAGVALICVLTHYRVNGPFAVTVVVCSFIEWIISSGWPVGVVSIDTLIKFNSNSLAYNQMPVLVLDLVFLYILYLNGLTSSLSRLADLTREDGSIPRGRWIYVLVGVMTVVSGLLTGVPILISPEGAAGIKEGAKTGLSTVVCGVLFLLSSFFAPIFQAVPPAGSAPVLIMVGALLFQNVSRIDWRHVKDSAPAFTVLFFIPFTYSLIQGVLVGYVIYVIVTLATGDLWQHAQDLVEIYFPKWHKKYARHKSLFDPRVTESSVDGSSGDGVDGRVPPEEDSETASSTYQSAAADTAIANQLLLLHAHGGDGKSPRKSFKLTVGTGEDNNLNSGGWAESLEENNYLMGYHESDIMSPRVRASTLPFSSGGNSKIRKSTDGTEALPDTIHMISPVRSSIGNNSSTNAP